MVEGYKEINIYKITILLVFVSLIHWYTLAPHTRAQELHTHI